MRPGDSFTGNLFTLPVPPGTALGAYNGMFVLLSGADCGAGDVLGIVSYSVTITPEPSSFMMFGTGLTGVVAVFRCRRFNI